MSSAGHRLRGLFACESYLPMFIETDYWDTDSLSSAVITTESHCLHALQNGFFVREIEYFRRSTRMRSSPLALISQSKTRILCKFTQIAQEATQED
jgi:hypothetical protein